MYQIANRSQSNPLDGHTQRQWNDAATELLAAMTLEHRQLVAAIHTNDGVSREQAELQVTAFEKHFKDDAL